MKKKNVQLWRKIAAIGVICALLLLMILSLIFGTWTFRLLRQVEALETENASLLVQTMSTGVEQDPMDQAEGDCSLSDGVASSQPLPTEQPDEAAPADAGQPVQEPDTPEYQRLYPDLMAEPVEKTDDNTQKVIYLTFDDGPSENTEKILDILAQYDAHAAFFVSGQFGSKEDRARQYNEILDSGSTIGLHSYSHDYEKIYSSVDAFLDDMNAIYQEVYEATGFRANMMRFPGGSINSYNKGCFEELIAEVTRRGFTYHDWVVSGEDAIGANVPTTSIINAVVEGCENRNKSVVLLHDLPVTDTTVRALPSILETLQAQGYEFRALDGTVSPFHFSAHS